MDYQDKKKRVETILENYGYDKNAEQVFEDGNKIIDVGNIPQMVVDVLEIYQALSNKTDGETLNYFEENTKFFTETVLDSNFKSFKEILELNYEVEKVNKFILKETIKKIALSEILKKLNKERKM